MSTVVLQILIFKTTTIIIIIIIMIIIIIIIMIIIIIIKLSPTSRKFDFGIAVNELLSSH